MNIKRFNADFGNSTNNFMADGYYFEFPTNVIEISEETADKIFVSPISEHKDLLDRLMISTVIDGTTHYYLVGEISEMSKLSNHHVTQMHDKIKSAILFVSFLAAVAYYNAISSDMEDNLVEIENMSTMLPIWILKREQKFSIAQKKMEGKFIGVHDVKVHTLGIQKEIVIYVNNIKCKIESEVARYAIKYKMVSEENDRNTIAIEKRSVLEFQNNSVVLVDIGGGSTDAVKLGKGLASPLSRESFQVIDIEPFLGQLEKLRREKLLEYFHDLHSLEKFIVQNYKLQKYVFENENNGDKYDFTEQITELLKEYSSTIVSKLLSAFKPIGSEVIKFIYFGGEAPILQEFIKKTLLNHMNEQFARSNHLFLSDVILEDKKEVFKPTSRTINLTALEILSINDTNNLV